VVLRSSTKLVADADLQAELELDEAAYGTLCDSIDEDL
jgi:hypothetical protein